jgi:hypothetical protein
MVDLSRITGVSIVSLILGSGLIVFGANTLYSDFLKQPRVIINIEASNSSALVSIVNTGTVTAHNMRITFYFNGINISDYTLNAIPDEQINFTSSEEPKGLLVATVGRLTPNNAVSIQTLLDIRGSNATFPYNIDITYDEGSTYAIAYIGKEPRNFKSPLLEPPVAERLWIFLSVIIILSSIAFTSRTWINKIKHLVSEIKAANYVQDIKNEITAIKETLEESQFLHSSIIPTRVWDDQEYDTKRKYQIFGNYIDYRTISRFYGVIKDRDSYFSNSTVNVYDPVNADTFRRYNEECAYLANYVLESINWKEHTLRSRNARIRYYVFLVFPLLILILVLYYFLFSVWS